MSTAITKVGGGWSIAPANMGELYNFAQLLAASDLVPKDYRDKPGNCVVAIQMGGELGLSPMQSIQNIAVINGRPSLWGDAMLAVCLPHLDAFDETDDGATATCTARRGNRTVTNTFSTEDAKRAGLAGKAGPWSQYPSRMRKMRARGFTLRDICADVLRGINSAEETSDLPKEVRAEVVGEPIVPGPIKKIAGEPDSPSKQERKSTPPPAATEPPSIARSFPNLAWAARPLSEAPFEILEDYRVWLEAVIKDGRRSKLHKAAQQALEDTSAEVEHRIEAEAARIGIGGNEADNRDIDPIASKLQGVIDKREAEPGGAYDTKEEGWGLTP